MPEKKKITVRLTTLEDDSDFLRDVGYWQRRGAQARLAETWRLSCLAYGLDPDVEHRMDKSIVRIRRLRAGRTRSKHGRPSGTRGRN